MIRREHGPVALHSQRDAFFCDFIKERIYKKDFLEMDLDF